MSGFGAMTIGSENLDIGLSRLYRIQILKPNSENLNRIKNETCSYRFSSSKFYFLLSPKNLSTIKSNEKMNSELIFELKSELNQFILKSKDFKVFYYITCLPEMRIEDLIQFYFVPENDIK